MHLEPGKKPAVKDSVATTAELRESGGTVMHAWRWGGMEWVRQKKSLLSCAKYCMRLLFQVELADLFAQRMYRCQLE